MDRYGTKVPSGTQRFVPPFTVFTKFLKEMSVRLNDPSFAFDKGSPSSFNTREKTTAVRGQIITNKMKLTQGKPANCLLHETDKHALSDCRTFNCKPIKERKSFVRMYCVFDVVMENTQPESVKNMYCVAYVTLIYIALQCMKREILNLFIAGKMEQFSH